MNPAAPLAYAARELYSENRDPYAPTGYSTQHSRVRRRRMRAALAWMSRTAPQATLPAPVGRAPVRLRPNV